MGQLVAEYGTIHTAAGQVDAARARLTDTPVRRAVAGTGSAAVEGAVADAARIIAARSDALADVLSAHANGARQAVTDLIAVDAAAAGRVTR